jgi:hypothetical protein
MRKPKEKPIRGKAALMRLRNEWAKWYNAGMPAREPMSKAELRRRIALLDRVLGR